MRKIIRGLVVVSVSLVAALTAVSGAFAQPSNAWPKVIALGTGPSAGTQHTYSLAWATVVGSAIKHPISAQAVGGTPANCSLIKKGELNLGMGNTYDVYLAARGLEHFKEMGKSPIRMMFVCYDMAVGIWTRAAAKITNFPDLIGKNNYFIFPPAPVLQHAAEAQLYGYGISFDKVQSKKWTSWNEMSSGIAEGTVDASSTPLTMGNTYHPTLYSIGLTKGISILSMSKDALARVNEKWPYLVTGIIPKGLYPNQTSDVATLSTPQMYYSAESMPSDMIYQLVKATWENIAALRKANVAFEATTIDLLQKGFLAPFHGGAIKYYKEIGVWTPEMQAKHDKLLAELK